MHTDIVYSRKLTHNIQALTWSMLKAIFKNGIVVSRGRKWLCCSYDLLNLNQSYKSTKPAFALVHHLHNMLQTMQKTPGWLLEMRKRLHKV